MRSQNQGVLGTHNLKSYGKAPESNIHEIATVGTGNIDKSSQVTTFRSQLVGAVRTR